MKRRESPLWIAVMLSITIALPGCTADPGSSPEDGGTPSPGASAAALPDPDDVPADTTDYSQDAGNEPKEYEYEDELPAAESVALTLCNLNQVYFKGLRDEKSGTPIVDEKLRASVVGLFDLLDYWDSLRAQYPESVDDIDTGTAISGKWDAALLSQDNGDEAAAQKAMASAEKLIAKLPKDAASECVQ